MFQITPSFMELIKEHANDDYRLSILTDLFTKGMSYENSNDNDPELKIKSGDLINIITASNCTVVAENTYKNMKKQMDNINQPIKQASIMVYTINDEKSLNCIVSLDATDEDIKSFHNLDKNKVLCSVVRIEFGDELNTIGWTIIGELEPSNLRRAELMMLENELQYRLK